MTVTEKVYAILIDHAAITALVPATRIKPPGNWQNLTRPYIVHFPASIEPVRTHEGLKALRIWDFYQVSVFSDSFETGDPVAIAIRDALDGNHDGLDAQFWPGSWYVGQGAPEEEVQIHQFALQFRIMEAL